MKKDEAPVVDLNGVSWRVSDVNQSRRKKEESRGLGNNAIRRDTAQLEEKLCFSNAVIRGKQQIYILLRSLSFLQGIFFYNFIVILRNLLGVQSTAIPRRFRFETHGE